MLVASSSFVQGGRHEIRAPRVQPQRRAFVDGAGLLRAPRTGGLPRRVGGVGARAAGGADGGGSDGRGWGSISLRAQAAQAVARDAAARRLGGDDGLR